MSIFFVNAGIDTGDIIAKRFFPILREDTLDSFIVRSRREACDLALDAMDQIDEGSVAAVRRGTVEPARSDIFGLRNVTQVRLLAPMDGWLVGDAGLVMRTSDLGTNWQTPPRACRQASPLR